MIRRALQLPRRNLLPPRQSATLCLACLGALPGLNAIAQTLPPAASTNTVPADVSATLDALGRTPITSEIPSQLPMLPWLGADSTPLPAWEADARDASPFTRPGLGVSALGSSHLPGAADFGPLPSSVPLGPFDLYARVGYDLIYGTGILSGPGREEATWRNTVSANMRIQAGPHWTVGYTPSYRMYSSDAYEDTLNHTVTLGWNTSFQNWLFNASHVSAISSDPLVETGRQTSQTTHSTSLGAALDLGPRGRWSTSVAQNLRFTDIANDVSSWDWSNAYDIPLRERLQVGAGLNVGFDSVSSGNDMISQQLTARVSGKLGDKIGYRLGAGVSFREILHSQATTKASPTANLGITYSILENTDLGLGFSHAESASYFSDQYTKNTSFQASLNQRISERWSAALSGGYRFTAYESTLVDTGTTREDSTYFARAAVNARLLNRISASLYYSFRSNSSDRGDFAFDSNQVGLSLSWSM